MDDAKKDLQSRCNKLWIQLNELQPQLDSATHQTEAENEKSSQTILQEKERQMKAEIEILTDCLKDTDLELPSHPSLLEELIKKDLKLDTQQLEELLLILRSSCELLQQDIINEENVRKSLECLRTSLENKVRQAEEVQNNITDHNSLEKLLDKKTKLERLYMTRTHQMAAFIQQHYPPLTSEHVESWHKKYGKGGSKMPLASSFMSLEKILELLMNKCLTTPNDAYILTDDSFWPPYIEMMLRCGMIQRHSDNSAQIKLIPFHL